MNIRATPRRGTVLYSFRRPTGGSNPYVSLLIREVNPVVHVRYFSWSAALFGHYDVFHVHWPETMVRGQTMIKRVGSYVMLATLIARLRIRNTRVVRTVHNVDPHERGRWFERKLLAILDSASTTHIIMSAFTEAPTPVKSTTKLVPHPHFIEWYEGHGGAGRQSITGRLANFGLLRPYKGVERLLKAFAESTENPLSLSIVGSCNDEGLRTEITTASTSIPGLSCDLRHVTDEELVIHIRTAELVVLPYTQMLNSGAVFTALSLARPVLVPRNPTNEALANEVGGRWVQMFDGQIRGHDLMRALERTRSLPADPAPDLSARGWVSVGIAHLEIYGFSPDYGAE